MDINSAGNGSTDEPDHKAGDPADRDEQDSAAGATPDDSHDDTTSADTPAVDQPLADFVDANSSSRGPDAAAPDEPVEPKIDETLSGTSGVEDAVSEPEVTQQMPAVDVPESGATDPKGAEADVTDGAAAPTSGDTIPAAPSSGDAIPAAPTSGDAIPAATASGDAIPTPTSGDAMPAAPTSGDAIPAAPTSGDAIPTPSSGDTIPAAPSSGDAIPAAAAADAPAEPAVTQQMPVVEVPPIESSKPSEGPTFTAPVSGAYQSGTATATATATATSSDMIAPPAPETSGERPRHMRSGQAIPAVVPGEAEGEGPPSDNRRKVLAIAVPVVVVLLLIAAWAIDTASHSGQVLRNVELAGQSIDGEKEEDLPKVVSGVAKDMAAHDVTIESGDKVYQAKAGELGLTVDEKATVEGALDVGRGDSLFVRPVKWVASFFSTRTAPIELSVSESTAVATLQRLQGADRTQPVEPVIQLAANGFAMVPGKNGVGINVDELSKELKDAALAEPSGPIKIKATSKEEAPAFTDEQAQALATRANEMTANGLKLKAGDHVADVPAQTLRGWLSQTVTDGKLDLAFNGDAAKQALPTLLGGVTAEPKNATVKLNAQGQPEVVPSQNGVTCCGEDSADLIWTALKDETPEVALEATVKEPEFTTEEVTAWGIKQPIGGARGYRDGAEVPSGLGPGFTTFHGPTGSRNHNINKIADEVNGAVIPPGGEWSINDHAGKRTYAEGYVDAGAIRNGAHVEEVGGGISQFATTTFNAAYFAGLDILESQSHSEWFNRYPPGREATMGFPHPDVRIRNNTPYGLLITTSHTATSVTVTFWSTPYATAAQTASNESASGVCRVVVTTRTRTYPDGKTEQDQFKSTYRPEGKFCDGSAVPPPPPG